ncbi:olfactory receptor 52E8-like [Amia ocellicauda]|uniref:olfactory receptor 52E8-like n=1 Tax=Amia ocellicauda TaxID=2972642 RepID=UPI003464A950|nr:O52K1 protein [Amia calva]
MQQNQSGITSHTEFLLLGFHGLGGYRQFLFIPFFLIGVLSFVGNAALIITIKTGSSLHSPMYVLICINACVDLTLPVIFVPKMLLSFLFDLSGISLLGCLFQMFFIHFVGSFQSTVLLGMALDRYVAICIPLHYNDYINRSTFCKFSAVVTLRNMFFVLLVVVLASHLSFCSSNIIDDCFCQHMALVSLGCGNTSKNSIIGLLAVFSITVIDAGLIVISYIKIFCDIFKTHSGKSREKAIHTCGTHLIVTGVSFSFTMSALLSYRFKSSLPPNIHNLISIMYLLFPGTFHPIIYGIRTKAIREQMLNLFQCKRIGPISTKVTSIH